MDKPREEVWESCYDDSWDGFIVPEAFAHPAKFARGLIAKIFETMLADRMLEPGDIVVDPFGGIATGGIIAAGLGLRWFGVELEEKFFTLGNQNIEKHRALWEQFGDPVPVLVQGDSRKLRENLRDVLAQAVVSSPPFCGAQHTDSRGENHPYQTGKFSEGSWGKPTAYAHPDSPGQLGAMKPGDVAAVVSSPPYANSNQSYGETAGCRERLIESGEPLNGCGIMRSKHSMTGDYGTSPGQLCNLPPGQVDSVVSSPPYAESLRGDNSERETAADSRAKRLTEGGSLGASLRHSGYGGPGNLGNLPSGEVEAVVTSPPWENQEPSHAQGSKFEAEHRRLHPTKLAKDRPAIFEHEYGDSAGQIGNEQGETFWEAARDIVRESFAILKPGGYSAWVVKDFIRNKQRVPFCDDWCKLLEACGFVVVKRVRAMLVKEQRHPDLFGGEEHVDRTERKSFFRRLYEKKYPENSIDWEEVVFARKPFANLESA